MVRVKGEVRAHQSAGDCTAVNLFDAAPIGTIKSMAAVRLIV